MVTVRPGAGKTTFAKTLGNNIFMPVISRDEIKEGYVHTFNKKHTDLPQEANSIATKIFFDTLEGLLINNVSVIAEAAFQHQIWSSMLEQFKDNARVHLLICKVEDKVAHGRFIERGLNNTFREYFHGDKGVDMARKGIDVGVNPYDEPHLDMPTFYIDTLGEYNPSIKELARAILEHL